VNSWGASWRHRRVRRDGGRGGDEASLAEARATLQALKGRAERAELEALLSGEADANDAYLEIKSGRGRDRVLRLGGMLMRMYTRWATAHGYRWK
jgi:peptide chain release factor 2